MGPIVAVDTLFIDFYDYSKYWIVFISFEN